VSREDVAGLAATLLSMPLTGAVVGPYDDADELPDELREAVSP